MKNVTEIARCIDHTLLRPDATAEDVKRLCAEAREHSFAAVCVQCCWVTLASHLLEDSDIKVATVVGFPLGGMPSDVKRYETEVAVDDGAQEIDMVINIGRLKDKDDRYVLRELRDVAEAADERPVKVILETCLLNQEEKVRACHLVLDSGARFVKTSTGFASAGATLEDVKLLRKTVGARFGVKASGGIRTAQVALALLEAGANRLGASASVGILKEVLQSKAEKLKS